MNSEQIETPQCYSSIKDHDGKSKAGLIFVSCHCSKSFYAECMIAKSMAEAIYQWNRDPESTVQTSKESGSDFVSKVDCILKGFEKLQSHTELKMKRRKPEEYHWKVNCKHQKIEKTGFKKLNIASLPKNTHVAIDMHCDSNYPDEVFTRVYCTADFCFEKSIDVFENSLISLKAFTLLQKSLNVGKLIHPAKGCKEDSPRNTQCVLMGFRDLVDTVVVKNVTKLPSYLTLKQIGESRLTIKPNKLPETVTSNNHIYSWFFMCLYFLPSISMFFVALCSCGNFYRNELGHFANPNLKDIESTLVMEMRKTEELNVSLKKHQSKPRSEIIDIAVTTTSHMGNMTDLGSEGPTGPSGTGSAKTIKKDALKSGEDTKDSTADAAL